MHLCLNVFLNADIRVEPFLMARDHLPDGMSLYWLQSEQRGPPAIDGSLTCPFYMPGDWDRIGFKVYTRKVIFSILCAADDASALNFTIHKATWRNSQTP